MVEAKQIVFKYTENKVNGFPSKAKKNIREINLSIDHNQIEQVPVFNFFGIILDTNLSWKYHTKMIANKISRVTCILYRLKTVFLKEEHVLVTLYKTLIASHIHYGLLVWGMDCNRIEGLQKGPYD